MAIEYVFNTLQTRVFVVANFVEEFIMFCRASNISFSFVTNELTSIFPSLNACSFAAITELKPKGWAKLQELIQYGQLQMPPTIS